MKDQFIELLRSEGEKFAQERQGYVEKLIQSSRQIGELETKLRQIEAPDGLSDRMIAFPSRESFVGYFLSDLQFVYVTFNPRGKLLRAFRMKPDF